MLSTTDKTAARNAVEIAEILLNEAAASANAQARVTLAVTNKDGKLETAPAFPVACAQHIHDKAPDTASRKNALAALRVRLNRAAAALGSNLTVSLKVNKAGNATCTWQETPEAPWQETAYWQAAALFAKLPSAENFEVLTEAATELAAFRAEQLVGEQMAVIEAAQNKIELIEKSRRVA